KLEGEGLVYHKDDENIFTSIDEVNAEGIEIAISIGSASIPPAKRTFPDAKFKETKGNARFQEVQSRRVDAAASDFTTARKYVEEHREWARLFPDEPYAGTPLVIGVERGQSNMIEFLNATLDYFVTQGFMGDLAEKHDE